MEKGEAISPESHGNCDSMVTTIGKSKPIGFGNPVVIGKSSQGRATAYNYPVCNVHRVPGPEAKKV